MEPVLTAPAIHSKVVVCEFTGRQKLATETQPYVNVVEHEQNTLQSACNELHMWFFLVVAPARFRQIVWGAGNRRMGT